MWRERGIFSCQCCHAAACTQPERSQIIIATFDPCSLPRIAVQQVKLFRFCLAGGGWLFGGRERRPSSKGSQPPTSARHEVVRFACTQDRKNPYRSYKAKGWTILGGVLVAAPVFLLKFFGLSEPACRTAFVAVLMGRRPIVPRFFSESQYNCAKQAFYWITEAIPIPVTSLLPLVLFPFFGVLKARAVAVLYLNDSYDVANRA